MLPVNAAAKTLDKFIPLARPKGIAPLSSTIGEEETKKLEKELEKEKKNIFSGADKEIKQLGKKFDKNKEKIVKEVVKLVLES